jgi:hypothetical protein
MTMHRYCPLGTRRALRPRSTQGAFNRQPLGPWTPRVLMLGLFMSVSLALPGCGGGSATNPAASVVSTSRLDMELLVVDVTGAPIQGAVATFVSQGGEHTITTDAAGTASFRNQWPGEGTLSVAAAGFDSFGPVSLQGGTVSWQVTLYAIGAWAIGQPIVLGTRMIDRADDGSTLAFSVDIAVIDEHAEALETLTSAEFSVVIIDCGWGGPRDCASDAAGNATHNFAADGEAQAFELLYPSPRRPYLVEVLAERSTEIDWEKRIPMLKSFFAALGGNDTVSLSTVHSEGDGSAKRTVLGPFTSDGSTYFGAIDRLADPSGAPPPMLESLLEAIQRVALADGFGIPEVDRSVLVLSRAGMSVQEIGTATDLARQMGVHVSAIGSYNYGFPEIAVRTGGFAGEVDHDVRQFGPIFGAMDRLLAGVTPYYRMQFRIKGPPGTFVPGGNAKVNLNIRVPTPLPSNGLRATLDVAIP